MTKIVPFTFNDAFDRPASDGKTASKPKRRTLTMMEIEAIEQKAFEAGVRHADTGYAKASADSLTELIKTVIALQSALEDYIQPARGQAIKLAYVIARKLAETLLANHPTEEIEALIGRCMDENKSEPAVVIRVNDSLHDTIKAAAQELKQQRTFEGRVVVIGEPQIPVADCTIEWADGGLERDFGRACAEIEAVFQGYLTSQCGCAETEQTDLFSALATAPDTTAGLRE